MLTKNLLEKMYLKERQSVSQIASFVGCSQNKINYWLQKYNIKKRSISEAVYIRSNPSGDPFISEVPSSPKMWFLYGLGIGLFWGEGNKVDKNSVRLGNSDRDLVFTFLRFLHEIYHVDIHKLRFGLQLFNDVLAEKALEYWSTGLGVSKKQFQKVVVTKSGKKGTYRKKSDYGVLTVYFYNTKLRDIIMGAITELREMNKPS